ncbi:PEP/pyruvate-binding domain-containing protein [Ornithinimicrobium avium]|uniref:Phosphoenolpyruvate synthase n=1 Tax=Ornithinimicrobium avium TaxID=2283195 RepID=A0A345NQY0_9MICO|nr:PEP/pyruvate-binding domain-containing protein [Ornithinimicrobium avium]AXH97438.1 phosphoenolpyruvate synthase [Ornithinimicrobium avium]
MEHCIPLGRLSRADRAVAGGKGANLGELVGAGYAVPPGFVVTTGAYRAAEGAAWRTVPPEVAAAVREAYAALGSPPVAVRSSATAEDLPGAAFAGQQDTYLNVRGAEAVVEAVRDCWASLRAERAVAYRQRLGIGEEGVAMAVVVQEMARPDRAGVLFTADPVTGELDRVVVDSFPGLGEAVVGGHVTPDHAVVDPDGVVVERRAGERAGQELPDGVLAELARVGRSVADHFGVPQDVEWVVEEGRVVLTQARPMTALPPPPVHLDAVRRTYGPVLLELLPRRPLPLELTAWTDEMIERHLARMLGGVGGVRLDLRQVLPRVDGVLQAVVPPVPRPTLRTPLRLARSAVRAVRHRADGWRDDPLTDRLRSRTDVLDRLDLGSASWAQLQAVQPEAARVLAEQGDLRARYLPAAARSLLLLALALLLRGRPVGIGELLVGADTETMRANAALDGLAVVVRDDPALRELFGTLTGEELAAAVAARPEAGRLRGRLEEFLSRYGHREGSTILLLSDPPWVDAPASVLGLVQALAAEPVDPADDRPARPRPAPARVIPASLAPLVAAAVDGVAMREDTHFELTRAMPALRRTFLEMGRRLAGAGRVDRADDIWWLVRDELAGLPDPAATTGRGAPPYPDLRVVVERRRAAAAVLAGSPLISPASLYPARPDDPDALVQGVPGGGGRATGPVRVVPGPAAFGTLRPGEVLVCSATSPPWTPLFARAAAVVVDHGGPASHAAIVAREYGVPVVLATGTATTTLRTGQVVTVDGHRGVVVPAT